MISVPRTYWYIIGLTIVGLVTAGCNFSQTSPTSTAMPVTEQATVADEEDRGSVSIAESRPPARQKPDVTETPSPSVMPSPLATSTVTPSPTPSPMPAPQLRQLTSGGCCTDPFWAPDSGQVLYIDAPPPDGQLGIWAVDATQTLPEPELFTERIAFYAADFEFLIEVGGDTTVIERVRDGERWTVPANGNLVYFSPDQERIAWNESDPDVPPERRTVDVWVTDLDGTNARRLETLIRGGFAGWLDDDVVLLNGRESFDSREEIYYTYSLRDDRVRTELIRAERARGASLSPNGRWLAYFIAQSPKEAQNGLWLVRTDGSRRRQLERELFGAYKWRDESGLLIVPFRPGTLSRVLAI